MKWDKNRIISYLMHVRSEDQDKSIKVASCCFHGVSLYTTFFIRKGIIFILPSNFMKLFLLFLAFFITMRVISSQSQHFMILPFPKNKAIITPTCNRLELGHGTLWERRFCCPWNKMGMIKKDQGVWLGWRWQKQKQCYPS